MNNPHDNTSADDVIQELEELIGDNTPPISNVTVDPEEDFSDDDLMFKAGHRTHRDTIEPEEHAVPEILLAPRKSRKQHKKRLPLAAKIGIGVAIGVVALLLIAVTVFFILYHQGRGELLDTPDMLLTLPDVLVESNTAEQSDDGRTVTYKGERYRFNEDRTNILCLGMDKRDLGLDYDTVGTAGQADTIVLLSIDTSTGQINALSISRDAIVDIDLHAEDGSFVGVEPKQICLAYAYGDGYHESCKNMSKAVSRLLYGIPVNTYFTINLSAIPTLNDAVGGVEVTLLKDFKTSDGYYHSKGETVVLNGRDAERYVRERDTEQLDSNNARMERQKQYIGNFFNKALSATAENLQVPLDLFNTVSADSVTNLSPSKITFLATTLVQHRRGMTFHSAPGTVVEGADGKAEFHVDDEALYELILQLFFTKVE
ncbi:MAG: LCP family protein [Clostridia bacterium]|nr:LCP family protein [Clostridia bacterium]